MPTMTRQGKRTKVSLKDIAREAQCSIAVASTVLNATKGCSVVSDSLRERVQTVAKRLNYRPHFASQSLIRGRTNTLGVYNPPGHRNGVGDGYAGRLLDGIELECLEHGYDLLLTNRVNEGSGETCLKKLAEQRVDGLIIFRSSLCSDWLPMLKSYANRVVLMDAESVHEPFHSVVFDNAGAIGKAVEYLAELGHTRIGFLGSCLDKPQAPWLLRQEGYLQAMRALGLPLEDCLIHDRNKSSVRMSIDDQFCQAEGTLGMQYFLGLSQSDQPTAVIGYNDLVAVNALRECLKQGLAVPQQMSVIGMGDSERCEYLIPGLTSLRHPLEEMGQCAARYLIQAIESKQESGTPICVEPFSANLVCRDSVTHI